MPSLTTEMRKRNKYKDIDPDDIFLDSENPSNMNQQQFEGVLEKPVSRRAVFVLGVVFLVCGVIFLGKVGYMQIIKGESYFHMSENNRLESEILFAERGVVYDRNGNEIAWNDKNEEDDFFIRTAVPEGFAHLVGYVAYPKKDVFGNYWRDEIIGESGIEKLYDGILAGENGQKIREIDATMTPTSEHIIKNPENGENLVLTIDRAVQFALFAGIKHIAESFDFQGGAGIIMDVESGDIIALTSYPEYSLDAMAKGDSEKITEYFTDPRKPFLNRAVAGLYTPGSTIKPFLAVGALEEGIVDERTTILSTGRIEVPNRYFPDQKSIFRDWRPEGHGTTDIKWALADSVNTFFYAIGGGYKDQEGLGIEKIDHYLDLFKIGQETGINLPGELAGTIPSPAWKESVFGERWYLGDTYITSIGQFGFQVSLPQMVRGIAAIANGGTLYEPRLVTREAIRGTELLLDQDTLRIVREGLRETVTDGTAQILNISYPHIAAKTGTAQVGVDNAYFNSWSTGFFPYEDPQYAFVVVMERGPRGSVGSASQAMRYMFDRLNEDEEFSW